jgi:uncharacterized protein (TIGR03437 family)
VGKIILRSLFLGTFACALHAATAVTVTTNPSALIFTYQSGTVALPKVQTVAVKVSSGKPTFTTSTPGTDFWLTVSPDAGILPGSVSVRVNPTSLAVGTYISAVTITVAGVASPSAVTVTLNVTSPPSTLTLSPSTMIFTAPPNPSVPQTVALTTDNSPISFTATAGSSWITVSPAVGIVLPGAPISLTITVDATNLNPQIAPYTGKITVVASGTSVTVKSQSIAVNVTVNSVTPTIASVWPPTLPVNAGAQTLTIRGANFYAATIAKVGATALATTVVSPSAILAVVPASMLTSPGSLNIIAENPAPGGDSAATAVPVASTPTIFGIFSAASYASAVISPGELVTIFGSNIGPTAPATLTVNGAGYVDTNLSNVTVTIDGQNAPLLYVSSNQVTAQVPYEASAGAGKAVVLTNGAFPAANSTVTIGVSAPGIFTADGSGVGQAAALNTAASTGQVTLNSSTAPAKIGDTVSLYLTGEGDYNLALIPGAVTTNTGFVIPVALTPLPQMSPLPTVHIGGVDASAGIGYSGVVPGSIVGVFQINVVVPSGSTTGATVPVVVTIAGNDTQLNVTLNVHP